MRSSFAQKSSKISASSTPLIDETYDLRGLNLITPDEIMPKGESPYTINSRMYARNDNETRVANRTRKGASRFSIPIGEALNISNIAASTGDIVINTTTATAQPFTPSSSGSLTKLELHLKKLVGASGHIIVEIYSNVSGLPGTMIAQGSILASTTTTSYQYLPAYFIDAPPLVSGTQYWVLVYLQDNGSGTYHWNKTAATGAYSRVNGVFTALGYSARYQTYLSTTSPVKGYYARYPSSATNNLILFAQASKIYSFPKNTSVTTEVDTGLSTLAKYVRFEQIDDYSIWVNGEDPARWWDGTTLANLPNLPSTSPKNIIAWQNRLFAVTGSTRYDFSALNEFTSWPAVNFFYVPSPKSPDQLAGHIIFQDNLVVFTHETKHIISGSDISTFTRRQAVGTKGAASQEVICTDRNYIYFMADDKQIYRYNGVSDDLISDKIQTELQAIADITKVRMQLYRNQLRVYYPKSPSSVNNQMMLYDLELKQWFMDTGHLVAGSMELYLDNNELVEFSSLVGAAYYGETQGSDLGKKLDWKYWTNYKAYGTGTAKKRIKRFRPIVRVVDSDYTMLVGKDMDFNNSPDMRNYAVNSTGAKWGAFVWGVGTLWGGKKQVTNPSPMSGRGNFIQYRFERSGVETGVELYGYSSQYKRGNAK